MGARKKRKKSKRSTKCPKCASAHVSTRKWGARIFHTCKICGKVWDEEAK